jgi:hypothetical protein
MRARLLISTFVAVMMLPTAQGDANRASRASAFAKLPDWTGVWQSAAWWPLDVSGRPVGGEAKLRQTLQTTREPPYNAKWAATYQEAMKDTAAIAERVRTFKVCERTFPQVMEAPWMFQVAVLPEETLIVFENGQVRHIYTDRRAHPDGDDLWPTPLGDSIGHWEGDTLVVDTIARVAEPLGPRAWFSVLSEQAHFTERLRRTQADELEDQLTIEDPETLARPWQMTLRFKHLADMRRMIPTNCTENDRNPVVDGEMKLTVPK